MNKKRNLQDRAKIVMECINTGILLLNCVADTTYLRPHSRTGKTFMHGQALTDKREDQKSCKGGRESQAHNIKDHSSQRRFKKNFGANKAMNSISIRYLVSICFKNCKDFLMPL